MAEAYDREGLIDRATDAINDGKPTRALEIADEIRKGEGPNADEALIRGIALSSLGRTAEASDAFAEATRRAPRSHKARFNAAVHEFNAGNITGARDLARQAQEIDPAHGGTRSLVEKISDHDRPAIDESVAPPRSTPPDFREAKPDDGEALAWIGRLGSKWTFIGWTISAVAFLSLFAVIVLVLTRASGASVAGGSMADQFQAGRDIAQELRSHPVVAAGNLGTFVTGMLATLWTILDLVRRKGNMLWVFGVVPLSCIPLTWLILPAYLIFGRKS